VVNHEALFTLSEIAVTMIGVSGLVAIFLSKGNLQPADRVRFVLILGLGILVAFFAYIPYWMSKYVTDASSVWQFSSILAVLAVSALVIPLGILMHAREALQAVVPKLVHLGASIFPLLAFIAHLINAVSWPINANSTLYEVALFLIILNMTFHFGSLVLYREPTLSVSERK
jgi:hypothetical protein